MPDRLGILLISPGHERAHYAFLLAAAAAAIGRDVTVFATNGGCHALTPALSHQPEEAAVQATGVAGLEELREAAMALGARLMACDAGLRMAGLEPAALIPGVEVSGATAFLSATAGGQLLTL